MTTSRDELTRLVVNWATATADGEDTTDEVCRVATAYLDAIGCILYTLDDTGRSLVVHTTYPRADKPWSYRIPVGFGVVGKVAADGVVTRLSDDSPRNSTHRKILGIGSDQRVSRFCVPLLGPDRSVVGVWAFHADRGRVYSEADEHTISDLVAPLLGLRLQRDQLLEELDVTKHRWQDLVADTVTVQEAERRRIAADIHDGVTQAIASLAFHLSAADSSMPADAPEALRQQIDAARALADLAFTEARRAVTGIRSPVLDDLGLPAALESLARSIPQLAVSVEAVNVDAPEHVATVLYRIAQESLNNAVRHAEASSVLIRLTTVDNELILSVSDDGRGFEPGDDEVDPDVGRGDSFGLVGMSERARLLGGTVRIQSRPGHGTTVRARVELPRTDAS